MQVEKHLSSKVNFKICTLGRVITLPSVFL
nr:MAG TPA: hypothetical protein [Caudoviricetes sp.]